MLRWSRHRVVAYCFLIAPCSTHKNKKQEVDLENVKEIFRSTDRPSPFHNSGRGTKRKRSNKSTPHPRLNLA